MAATPLRYMGSKVELTGAVHDLLGTAQANPTMVADLFAGTGTVSSTLPAAIRAVASDVMQSTLCVSRARLLASEVSEDDLARHFRHVLRIARQSFLETAATHRLMIDEETTAVALRPERLRGLIARSRHVGNSPELQSQAAAAANSAEHALVRLYFSRAYFSTAQAIALDAFRGAIDSSFEVVAATSWQRCSVRDFLLAVWLSTASSMSNSPGHTAQFLRGETVASRRRVQRAWSMDPFAQLEKSFARMTLTHLASARRQNRVRYGDATTLARTLRLTKDPRRTIFYADPPYTKDHYSRLYHVLETLYLYDYPDSIGVGRMRSQRFQSDFSYKTRARAAICSLATTILGRGASLLLSYPDGGLISMEAIVEDLKALGTIRVRNVQHKHSSLGARHGRASKVALEHLILVETMSH